MKDEPELRTLNIRLENWTVLLPYKVRPIALFLQPRQVPNNPLQPGQACGALVTWQPHKTLPHILCVVACQLNLDGTEINTHPDGPTKIPQSDPIVTKSTRIAVSNCSSSAPEAPRNQGLADVHMESNESRKHKLQNRRHIGTLAEHIDQG